MGGVNNPPLLKTCGPRSLRTITTRLCYPCATHTPLTYQGKGLWHCDVCGHVLDLSEFVYSIIVRYTEQGVCITSSDERLTRVRHEQKDPYTYIQYLADDLKEGVDNISGYPDDHPHGFYDTEIFWCWNCSDYEYDEWDLEMEILSEQHLQEVKPNE